MAALFRTIYSLKFRLTNTLTFDSHVEFVLFSMLVLLQRLNKIRHLVLNGNDIQPFSMPTYSSIMHAPIMLHQTMRTIMSMQSLRKVYLTVCSTISPASQLYTRPQDIDDVVWKALQLKSGTFKTYLFIFVYGNLEGDRHSYNHERQITERTARS